jgi:hypothetical protein
MKRLFIVLMLSAYNVTALGGDGRDLPFESVHRGSQSGVVHTTIVEIHDRSEWEQLLISHDNKDFSATAPTIDCETHFVVAMYLGGRPSGGYSVEIKRIVADAGKATLHVAEDFPGKGCVVTTVQTTPYHYVVVAKPADGTPFDFQLTRTAHDCS